MRLIGPTIDEVKAARGDAGYLVEWDFPDGLGMDAYLARKKRNAPKYAQVPETTFLRTYVCEDMTKCLCFYRAPDEDAVLRAREAVETPVTRIGRVQEAPRHVRASRSSRRPHLMEPPSGHRSQRELRPSTADRPGYARGWRSWASWGCQRLTSLDPLSS